MADTKFVQLRGFIDYPKLFEDKRDMESTHKGKDKALKNCEGEYSLNFYPVNQEELEKAKTCGLSSGLYGGSERFKNGNTELGEGVFFKLARKHKDVREVELKDGTTKVFDNGGAPELVWFNEDKGFNTPWNRETDGEPDSGSEVVVKFSVYGDGTSQTVRLIKIGVINQVVYSNDAADEGIRF